MLLSGTGMPTKGIKLELDLRTKKDSQDSVEAPSKGSTGAIEHGLCRRMIFLHEDKGDYSPISAV